MAEVKFCLSCSLFFIACCIRAKGLARQLSTTFLGKAIDGIWHTGVVVYGNEYYFGGGIQHLPAGTTPYGTPIKVVDLGITHVPQDVFEEYLQDISSRYSAETYSLLTHNCNNFSNEVAQFLVGVAIPEYILHLPNEVMNSPMGALIMPMIQNLESTLRAGAVPQVPQFRPPSAQTSQTANIKSDGVKPKEPVTSGTLAPHDVKSAEAKGKTSVNGITVDPLGDARNKVQEEISREFAAIMASGTFRAGEAAALATKRVMQRYGHLNAAMPQS
ncbi:hypothetical protein OIU77_024315 [Salix suchowensis]|uniref:PPPDE domain-containing protein n=1 Tax=Salix suchowensis TaxID=1278906 RepID=A0ABQ9BSB2_9ROSI|nr:hypothetical protein OIU77_024315 [Salix suchowensis]